ncbi:MAG: hypothetical protein WC554_08595 [Clostridia bacterium]
MKKTILSLFILLSVNVFAQLSPRARFGIVNDTTDFGINIPKGSEVVDLKDSLIYLCVQSATEFDDLTSASVKFKWINGYTGDTANIAYLNQENTFTKKQVINDSLNVLKKLQTSDAIVATGTFGSGWTEPNLGAGTRMMWYPRKAAFRAGEANTYWNNDSIGIASTAFGRYTKASGYGSTASGYFSSAIGIASTAFGYQTTASGSTSTAFGTGSSAIGIASTAFGYQTTASGYGSTASGNQTTASGNQSTSMGSSINSTGRNGFGIGLDSTGIANIRTFSDSNSLAIFGARKFYVSKDGQDSVNSIIYANTASDWLRLNGNVTVRNKLFLRGLTNDATPDSILSVVNAEAKSTGKWQLIDTAFLATHYWTVQNYQAKLTNPVTTPNIGVSGYIPHYSGAGTIDTSNLFYDVANKRIGLGTASPSNQLTQKSTVALESAPLGSELTDGTGWTSTDWTGDYATGFTHTTGNTSPLSRDVTITTGSVYQISWTVTGMTTGTFTVSLGGETSIAFSTTNSFGPKMLNNTGDLIFTPTSTFNGTISNISVKSITGIYGAIYAIQDKTGINSFEIRNNLNSLGNIFVGKDVGGYNTTGDYNSAMGYQALSANTTGYRNSAMGNLALYANTTGYYNSAMGYQALSANTTGYSNSAMGYQALSVNTTGYSNSAMGFQALYANTTGYYNSAMGFQALSANTTGYRNSAMGFQALSANTTGYYNSAMGFQALSVNTTGYYNSAMGLRALYANTTGDYNSAMGNQAGMYIADGTTGRVTGDYGLYLGYNTKASADGTTNEVVIGSEAIGKGSNTVTIGSTSVTNTYLKGIVNISSIPNSLSDTVVVDSAGNLKKRLATSLPIPSALDTTRVAFLNQHNAFTMGQEITPAAGEGNVAITVNGTARIADTMYVDDAMYLKTISNSLSDSLVVDSAGYLKKRSAYSLPINDATQDSLNNIYTQAQTDALLLTKQNVSDTSVKDATRYWVGQQAYLTVESDPVWISDSTDYLHKSDTNTKVASRKWVTDLGYTTNTGTITSISQGTGMLNSVSPITTTGTIGVDTTKVVMFNDTLTAGKIATKYGMITGDSAVKQGIRAEYVNHDSVAKQTIRTEYVNHDSTAVKGLRTEMNNHDTLVRQYVRTWIDTTKVLFKYDTLNTSTSAKIATKYDIYTKTITDSIPFIHNAPRNSTYLRNSTDRVTIGSGVTTANVNRKLHVAGSMYLQDTMWFPNLLYFFGNAEHFNTKDGWEMSYLHVDASDVHFTNLLDDSSVDSVLTLEGGVVKRTSVSPGVLSIDTMKIVRTDQIDTLTKKLYLTGIPKQDTATRVLGYNVGTGEVKAMRYIHGVASADSMVAGGNNYITIGGTQYLYYKINTSGASPGAMAVRDTVGVLIQGDSCKILTAGHYKIRVWVAATTSNANDKIRIKLFTNNVANPTALGRFLINSMGTGNQSTENYMWYKEFSVNDWISFHVTNITGSRAVYISDMKFFIERVYE